MLALAIAIAAEAFKTKVDKGGNAYILHCLHVMNDVGSDEERQQAAVLHDLVEDCPDWSIERLRSLGFSERVLTTIDLVTFRAGEDYMSRIRLIAANADATEVKKADLRHNTQLTRLKGLRKKDFERLEKYCTAYTYLS